jgi:hypothetical protein
MPDKNPEVATLAAADDGGNPAKAGIKIGLTGLTGLPVASMGLNLTDMEPLIL